MLHLSFLPIHHIIRHVCDKCWGLWPTQSPSVVRLLCSSNHDGFVTMLTGAGAAPAHGRCVLLTGGDRASLQGTSGGRGCSGLLCSGVVGAAHVCSAAMVPCAAKMLAGKSAGAQRYLGYRGCERAREGCSAKPSAKAAVGYCQRRVVSIT